MNKARGKQIIYRINRRAVHVERVWNTTNCKGIICISLCFFLSFSLLSMVCMCKCLSADYVFLFYL